MRTLIFGAVKQAERVLTALDRRNIRVLPWHYYEPTPGYALQKLGRDVTERVFLGFDRVGLHVMPKHFYTPIADYAWLRQRPEVWQGRASLTGVEWDLDAQVEWLRTVCEPYLDEVAGLQFYADITASGAGPGYEPIEAQVLHCYIRAATPARVVEVGGGATTAVMLHATEFNARDGKPPTQITTMEPYPSAWLKARKDLTLVPTGAEEAPLAIFDQLEAGDLLFVDSSHAVKLGSEVVRLCHEIIPRLPAGVTIHFHDIFLPYLYPREALTDYWAPQETSLLLALMTENPRLSVLCCQAALHYDRLPDVTAILPDYRPQASHHGLAAGDRFRTHFPKSLWLQTVEPAGPAAMSGHQRAADAESVTSGSPA